MLLFFSKLKLIIYKKSINKIFCTKVFKYSFFHAVLYTTFPTYAIYLSIVTMYYFMFLCQLFFVHISFSTTFIFVLINCTSIKGESFHFFSRRININFFKNTLLSNIKMVLDYKSNRSDRCN